MPMNGAKKHRRQKVIRLYSVVIEVLSVKKDFYLTKIRRQPLNKRRLPDWVFRSLFRKTSTCFPVPTRFGGVTGVCIDLLVLRGQASHGPFQAGLMGVD